MRYCQFPGFCTGFKVEIVQCHDKQPVSAPDSCRVGNKIRGNFAGLFTPGIEFADQLICPEIYFICRASGSVVSNHLQTNTKLRLW
ncbi:hypothetical protein AMK87_10990 [Escherichia coli]|nr:hypothetical protein AML36_00985 [Escherichia coli]KYV49441.1 hypothetical protein AMK78_17180 [Escherichia coli]KYV88773.1 hypothetical protein AMK87_10990 [Escherichia coli]